MSDLYATLGVPKDADHATIRRAYRRRAKAAHPDGGGSPKAFALVKLAHDTLTDDARRARYDQTGEAEESPVDNKQAQLLEMLAMGLDLAMGKLGARPVHQVDLVKLTKDALRDVRRDKVKQRAEFEEYSKTWRDILDRLSAKTPEKNPMVTIVAPRIKGCDAQIAKLSEQISVVDRALAALDDVSFRFDRVSDPSPAERWMNGQVQPGSLMDMLGKR